MKINKKIICLAAAAVMSVSAVAASAATIPVPSSNNDAFRLAESFYYDGLYYEAKQALDYVTDPGEYDVAKAAAWGEKINNAISRLEIDNLFGTVQWYNDNGNYEAAVSTLATIDARADKTENDFYSILWWEQVLSKKMAENGASKATVLTSSGAIQAVKNAGYTLTSDYEWYSPVKVGDGYHVYIQTQLPGGGSKDVAGFRVAADGTVERAF